MSFIMIQVHDSDDIPHVSFTRATRHDEIDDLTRINLVINLFHSEEEKKRKDQYQFCRRTLCRRRRKKENVFLLKQNERFEFNFR